MSKIEEIVSTLETRINKVLSRMEVLKESNQKLEHQLQSSRLELQEKENEITSWKERYEALKVANTMLGSDNNKRETKLKINSLIREIDHCIAQLAE